MYIVENMRLINDKIRNFIKIVVSKNCCSTVDSNSCQRVPSQARYH